MQIRIYQIKESLDTLKVKSLDLEELKRKQGSDEIDASIYEQVFSAEIEDMGREVLYSKINTESHPLYYGDRLGISDIVVSEEGAFYYDKSGTVKVEFDECEARKPENLIRILYVEPHKKPYVAEIPNTLRAQQKAVFGLMQYLNNRDGTITVINDEGKINGMEGNRRIEGDVLVGPFFVAGDAREDLCSLTDEQIEKYAKQFEEPEDIPRSEIEAHAGFVILPWPFSM